MRHRKPVIQGMSHVVGGNSYRVARPPGGGLFVFNFRGLVPSILKIPMNNVERLSQLIAKTGAKNILIHSIPSTKMWIVCQKIEKDKWTLTLMDPMKDTARNLGTVNNKEHLNLWRELVEKEIEIRSRVMSTSKI